MIPQRACGRACPLEVVSGSLRVNTRRRVALPFQPLLGSPFCLVFVRRAQLLVFAFLWNISFHPSAFRLCVCRTHTRMCKGLVFLVIQPPCVFCCHAEFFLCSSVPCFRLGRVSPSALHSSLHVCFSSGSDQVGPCRGGLTCAGVLWGPEARSPWLPEPGAPGVRCCRS